MWVSLFMALLTYLLSDTSSSDKRKKALLSAAAVGGLAYAATANTDWGKDVSDKFDNFIGVGGAPVTATPIVGADSAAATSATSVKPSSLWSTVSSWGAAGTAAVVGAVGLSAGAATGSINWILLAAVAGGAILLLK